MFLSGFIASYFAVSAAGESLEVNEALVNAPELVNSDPFGEGWMIKMKVVNIADVEALMDTDSYREHVGH